MRIIIYVWIRNTLDFYDFTDSYIIVFQIFNSIFYICKVVKKYMLCSLDIFPLTIKVNLLVL